MTKQHTRGPWRYTDGGIIDNQPLPGFAGVEIADVYGADLHDSRGPDFEESCTNARLIAAAPELLAMCKAIREEFDKQYVGTTTMVSMPVKLINRVEAAIAKAYH